MTFIGMQDCAATAEICRAQLWQWIRYGAKLEDGRPITSEFQEQMLEEILNEILVSVGPDAFAASQFVRAGALLSEMTEGDFQEFLTTVAYRDLD